MRGRGIRPAQCICTFTPAPEMVTGRLPASHHESRPCFVFLVSFCLDNMTPRVLLSLSPVHHHHPSGTPSPAHWGGQKRKATSSEVAPTGGDHVQRRGWQQKWAAADNGAATATIGAASGDAGSQRRGWQQPAVWAVARGGQRRAAVGAAGNGGGGRQCGRRRATSRGQLSVWAKESGGATASGVMSGQRKGGR